MTFVEQLLLCIGLAVSAGMLTDFLQFCMGDQTSHAPQGTRIFSRFGAWAARRFEQWKRAHDIDVEMNGAKDRPNPWKVLLCPWCMNPYVLTLLMVVAYLCLPLSWWVWLLWAPLVYSADKVTVYGE